MPSILKGDAPIGLNEQAAVLPSLPGLGAFCDREPSVKTLGYFQERMREEDGQGRVPSVANAWALI
jgi:hypothetical protein